MLLAIVSVGLAHLAMGSVNDTDHGKRVKRHIAAAVATEKDNASIPGGLIAFTGSGTEKGRLRILSLNGDELSVMFDGQMRNSDPRPYSASAPLVNGKFIDCGGITKAGIADYLYPDCYQVAQDGTAVKYSRKAYPAKNQAMLSHEVDGHSDVFMLGGFAGELQDVGVRKWAQKMYSADVATNRNYLFHPFSYMTKRRSKFSLAIVGHYLFALGYGKKCERYNLRNPYYGAWEPIASLPKYRQSTGAAVYEGKIWLCGGTVKRASAGGKDALTCLIYDPAADDWSYGPSMQRARSRFGLFKIRGKLHAVGGDYKHRDYKYRPSCQSIERLEDTSDGKKEWRLIKDQAGEPIKLGFRAYRKSVIRLYPKDY